MFLFRSATFLSLTLICAGVISSCVHADTIVLKNGKKFEGIIKNQNPSKVTIDIGLGTISFQRAQIDSIEHSKRESIRKNWSREYSTRGRFVPPGMKDLADQFSALEQGRNNAIKAKSENLSIQRERVEMFDEFNAIQNTITGLAAQFQAVVPQNNVARYNALVKRQNQLASRALLVQEKLQSDSDRAASNRKRISDYLNQLDTFKAEITRSRKALEPDQIADTQTMVFFAGIDERLDHYATEFQHIEVPHQGPADHLLVKVRVNDRLDGLFLLDTGATYVTLSRKLARNLGLGDSAQNNVPVSLANGQSIDAQAVILDSMQTGNARVNGVIAMILPESPFEGVDGLLGMSFLREFNIQLDPVNKKLVFQKFSPD